MFRALEFGGEAGEVLNEVKNFIEKKKGWKGSRTTVDKLRDEIGDVMCTLDSLAGYYGIDLEDATIRKFNEVSDKHGFAQKL